MKLISVETNVNLIADNADDTYSILILNRCFRILESVSQFSNFTIFHISLFSEFRFPQEESSVSDISSIEYSYQQPGQVRNRSINAKNYYIFLQISPSNSR